MRKTKTPLTKNPLIPCSYRSLAGALLVAGCVGAPSSVALAQTACGAGQTAADFAFTGAAQQFTVPAGVTQLLLQAFGAQGGPGASGNGVAAAAGGLGAQANGTLSVAPGAVIHINVGGQANAFNGGGAGGLNNTSGGGGGATDVRVAPGDIDNRVLTAGGGGGGGASGASFGWGATFAYSGSGGGGGAGGGVAGGDGANVTATDPYDTTASFTSGGAKGGTVGAGGAASAGCPGYLGTDGAVSDGGNGAVPSPFNSQSGSGGGGGGGVANGGGGGGGSAGEDLGGRRCGGNQVGAGGGGAGGTSGAEAVVTGFVNTNGVRTGNGMLRICYASASPVVAQPVSVPTLSGAGLALLGVLTAGMAARARRRKKASGR